VHRYSIYTIVVNDVPGDFEASSVISGASNRNTISIIDIELCGRTIGAGLIDACWWWLLLVVGHVIAITVDDVVVYDNLSAANSINNLDS